MKWLEFEDFLVARILRVTTIFSPLDYEAGSLIIKVARILRATKWESDEVF